MRKPRSDGRSYPMNDFLPVILTIVRQSWNEFMTNPFYPGIVTLMLGVRVSNFELDTISGIEKDLTQHRKRTSQPDALHLSQCNLVLCPIVEFGL